jgi:ABC-type multidrug transport system fused ATPase/permease subunit
LAIALNGPESSHWIFAPTAVFEGSMFRVFKRLIGILDRRERFHAVLILLFSLVVAVAEVVGVASILPFMSAVSDPATIETNRLLRFLREMAPSDMSQGGFLILLGVLVMIVINCSLAVRAVGIWSQVKFSTLRGHSISYRLMKAYVYQPYSWFLDQHTSKMTTTVLGEARQVVGGSLLPAMQIISKAVVALALITLLVVSDPTLAIISVMVVGTAYGVIYILSRNQLKDLGERRRLANQRRFRAAHDAFGGIKDIFIIGRESSVLERFRKASEETALYTSRATVTREIPPLAMQGLVFSGMIAVVLYLLASYGTLQDALPVLSLYALAGYRLMPEIQALYRHVAEIRVSESLLTAIYNDLKALDATARKPHTSVENKWVIPPKPGIELLNVGFTYPSASLPALENISLQVPAYSTVGIVGTTGSGKTTLVDIILGLLSPAFGKLLVDGRTVNQETVREWQDMIGYVPQQIFLTDHSVSGNIAFGIEQNDIDQKAVERAARIANLHDFIMNELPNGYDTRIGEKGVRLSGGQRQRIGIARALYRDPEVLILDEATSALDNLTEKAVMEAVEKLSMKKTIIMIAHRLTTVKDCDNIVFLEAGKVSEVGSYDELVKRSSTFRKLTGESV